MGDQSKINDLSIVQSDKQAESGSVSVTDVIQKTVGQFGKWHLLMCVLLFPSKIPAAWHQTSIIFLAPPISFECVEANIDRCSMNCSEVVFNRSMFLETIQTEWNLICDQSQWANAVQTIFMSGTLIGSLIFGSLADRYGRRYPFLVAIFIQMVTGVLTSFVPWFWVFCVLKFVTGMATGGALIISFVMIMEFSSERWRETVSILFHVPFQIGLGILPLMAYYLRDWKYFQFVISIPTIVFIIHWWLLPESPRWLLAVGKVDDATSVLVKAAEINKLPTEGIQSDLNNYIKKQQTSANSVGRGTFADLFRTQNMRKKTLLICLNWFACGLSYFGIAQYIGQSDGNIYYNVFISAWMSLPGFVLPILLMRLIGRRCTLAASTIIIGLCMITIAFLPNWRVELGTLALTGSSCAFGNTYLYSGELFPTVVRNLGMGLASTLARIGSMIAPFVLALGALAPAFPPIALGIIPLISGVSIFMLPETRGLPLPATIEEGEKI